MLFFFENEKPKKGTAKRKNRMPNLGDIHLFSGAPRKQKTTKSASEKEKTMIVYIIYLIGKTL